jgi:predicted glycoside hydrolase/deacetylase ChbG (UPF0249 family)
MSERHIIICADDYGISPAVSAAIRDLVARRRINATWRRQNSTATRRRSSATWL